jgi:hypothetical protein
MKFTLTRKNVDAKGAFGELKNAKLELVAYTAEHSYDVGNGNFQPKIPVGVYTCKRGMHRLHSMVTPFETFEIENVPGHTNVLLHMGNWPQIDSDGCILLGEAIVPSGKGPMVTNSKAIWAEFMEKAKGLDTIQLEVV